MQKVEKKDGFLAGDQNYNYLLYITTYFIGV